MANNDVEVKFGADVGEFSDKLDVITAKSKGYDKALVDALNASNLKTQEATKAMEGLNFATSQAIQEYFRLGHEAMTGNFSRMPGSVAVLANRLGGLQTITSWVTAGMMEWTAAIGVAAGVVYELYSVTVELENAQTTVAGAFDASGASLEYNAEEVNRNIAYMREYESISKSQAISIAEMFARISTLTVDSQAKLERYVTTWRQITNAKDNESAAANFAKIFTEPAKAAEEMAKKYPGIISAADAWRVEQDESVNGADHAAEMLLDIVGPKLDAFRTKYVEPQVGVWEELKRAVDKFNDVGLPGLFNMGNKGALPNVKPTASQQAAIDAQKHQQDLNQAEETGLEIVQRTHGANSELNTLLKQREDLVRAANASMEKGDDDLTVKYEAAMKDVDAKITAEKKRQNQEATAAAKRAAQQQIEIERERVSTTEQLSRIDLETKRQMLQEQVDAGQISHAKESQMLMQYENQDYNTSYNALMQELQLDKLDEAQKQQVYGRIEILYAQHIQRMQQIRTAEAAKEKADQDKLANQIKQPFDQMLNGILQGTQTWQMAMGRLFQNLAMKFIEDIVIDPTSKYLASLVMQVSATNTKNAAILASDQATSAASTGFHAASALAKISADAAEAYAGVFAWAAPMMGPFAAVPAAAAYALVMAKDALVGSFDTGTSYVPRTGLAMVHEGEAIIPASQNTGGGGGVTLNVSALDAKSFLTFVNNPSIMRMLAKNIGGYMASNPSTRGAY